MTPWGGRLSVTARIALLAIALALVSNLALIGFLWKQTHDVAIAATRREMVEQSDALIGIWRDGGLPRLSEAVRNAQPPGDTSLVVAMARAGERGTTTASAVWNASFDAGTGVGALVVGVVAAAVGLDLAYAVLAALLVLVLPLAVRVTRPG